MDPAYCPRLNECSKVRSIMDRDMLFHQYAEAIRKVCSGCEDQGWMLLQSFGFTANIYARENMRRVVEKETGKVIVEYDVKKRI